MSRYIKNAIIVKPSDAGQPESLSLRLKQLQKLSGSGVLDDELNGYSTARADFRVRVLYLQKIPRTEWNIKLFRGLGNKLFEIKWKSGKVQWRALGYDADGYFVIVKVCTHKDDVYDPANCKDKAHALKADASNGTHKVINYVL